jgi:hypothetical protein
MRVLMVPRMVKVVLVALFLAAAIVTRPDGRPAVRG